MPGWLHSDEVVVGSGGNVYVQSTVGGTVTPNAPTSAISAIPAAYQGTGYLDEDGVTLSVTPNVQDFNVWQSKQPVRRETLASEIVTSFKAAQWNEYTVPLAFGGSANSVAAYRYDFPTDTQSLEEFSMIVDVSDRSDANHHRFYWKRGNVTEPVESVFNRSSLATLAIGFKALAPTTGGSPGSFFSDQAGFATGS